LDDPIQLYAILYSECKTLWGEPSPMHDSRPACLSSLIKDLRTHLGSSSINSPQSIHVIKTGSHFSSSRSTGVQDKPRVTLVGGYSTQGIVIGVVSSAYVMNPLVIPGRGKHSTAVV